MKRKLLCLLLVLCTVSALLPVLAAPAAAEETKTPVKYDDLYVKNGLVIWLDAIDPENGTVDLDAGTWKSKVGTDIAATLRGGKYDPTTNPMGWKAGEKGGILWDQRVSVSTDLQQNGVYLDPSLIPLGNYTVEIVAAANGYTGDDGKRAALNWDTTTSKGFIYGRYLGESIAVGTIRTCSFVAPHTKNGAENPDCSLGHRWYYTALNYKDFESTDWPGHPVGYITMEHKGLNYDVNEPFVLGLMMEHYDANTHGVKILYDGSIMSKSDFTVSKLGGPTPDGKLPANNAGYASILDKSTKKITSYIDPKPENVHFQFYVGFPALMLGVRVYDRVLTDKEMARNRCVDIAQYVGADMTDYAQMPAEIREVADAGVCDLGFDTTKEAVEGAIASTMERYAEQLERLRKEEEERQKMMEQYRDRPMDKYDKYYVTDGLTVWLDAFVAFPELNNTMDLENGIWKSKVGDTYATIGGASYWSVSPDGRGIGYRLNKEQYKASLGGNICPIGLMFDPSLIEGKFTVDVVAKLVGLTNDDGTRFVDSANSSDVWGIYTQYYSSFSFASFKAMTFICKSNAIHGTNMAHRWCYTPLEWQDHNGGSGYYSDDSIASVDPNVPLNYTFIKSGSAVAVTYNVYLGMPKDVPTVSRTYTTIADPEPEFHLFRGFPTTVYAVRVYDRPLSDAERSRNHFADILSYYGLDTEFLDIVLASTTDTTVLLSQFDDVGFDSTAEAVAEIVTNRLSGAWLKNIGAETRLDGKVGVRALFELNTAGIRILEDNGYKIEIGALLNVGGSAYPTLDGYQYKVQFRTEDGKENEAFFIEQGEGTAVAAFAVDFCRPTPEMRTCGLYYAGYVILKDAQGNTRVMYTNCETPTFDYNAYSLYDYLRAEKGYGDDTFITETVNGSFYYHTILVDAEAGNDENDGENAPVKTLDGAFARLLELLNAEALLPVDVTVKFSAGKFTTDTTRELNAARITAPYFRISFIGEDDDETTITSNREIDGNRFTRVAGKPYYKLQFEKDEKGNYPEFRFFYVNGKVAKLATNGFDRTRDAEDAVEAKRAAAGKDYIYDAENAANGMFVVPYPFAGLDDKSASLTYKLYLPEASVAALTDQDLATGQVEFYISMAWYMRILHITGVDRSDKKDGNVAVYFVPDEINQWTATQSMDGCYFWLRNAQSFVDEPGEFFYNYKTGELYYYPEEDLDMQTATFEIPVLDDVMFSFIGTEYVTLDSLHLYGNDNRICMAPGNWFNTSQADGTRSARYGADSKALLYFKNTTGTAIRNCLIEETPQSGMKFVGATRRATIDSNRIFHIGCTGIDLGLHNGTFGEYTNANDNCLIRNNYLNDIAWFTYGSIGIFIGLSRNLELCNNTIRNTSYTAISMGWAWAPAAFKFGENWQTYGADIHNNYIESFLTDSSDGGAIYTIGGNVENDYLEYFNSLHDNVTYVNDVTWNGKGMVMPWYHDGASSNWHDYGNVLIAAPFRNLHTPFYLQNIQTQLTHNIMVEENEFLAPLKTWEQYSTGEGWDDEAHEAALFGRDTTQATDNRGVFPTRVNMARHLKQQNNYLYDSPLDLPGYVVEMIYDSGSEFWQPDGDAIVESLIEVYEIWYQKLEEDAKN